MAMETKYKSGFVDRRSGRRWPDSGWQLGQAQRPVEEPVMMRLYDWLSRRLWMPLAVYCTSIVGWLL